MDHALGEDDPFQVQRPRRLLVFLLEGPVVAAVGLADQLDIGGIEAQHRDHDALVQQRQWIEGERELADAGHLAAHLVRVAHVHVLGYQVGPGNVITPGLVARRHGRGRLFPRQRQVAGNLELAPDRLAGARVEPGARLVPVVVKQDNERNGRHGNQYADDGEHDFCAARQFSTGRLGSRRSGAGGRVCCGHGCPSW